MVVELANPVSELLNDTPDKDEYRTLDDQKKHMLHIAKKINKKRSKYIQIINIEDNNKELFALLRSQRIAGLDA